MSGHPWNRTPLIESPTLSQYAGCQIFLKLETHQPSGSFKYRGISNLMSYYINSSSSKQPIHFYCSSGGNAGLACATYASLLGHPATICVPLCTSPLLLSKLRSTAAAIHSVGENWKEADTYLREELLNKDQNGVYVPPFDHEVIWEGAESLMEETFEDMGEQGPDGVVCAVGGGSMLSGIMGSILHHEGIDRSGCGKTPKTKVLAVETRGADSLNASLRAGEHVALPGITSIATSLGIVKVAARAYEMARLRNVDSVVLSDAEAAMGAVRLWDDEGVMVEISCGVALAAVYNGTLRAEMGRRMTDDEWARMKVVVIVCGGSDVSASVLEEYRAKYTSEAPSMASRKDSERVMSGGLNDIMYPHGLGVGIATMQEEIRI